jgi:hypothetical protein
MKIKIGNDWFDPENVRVMVVLSDEDKKNIASMTPDAHKYASFPEGSDIEEIRAWMKE